MKKAVGVAIKVILGLVLTAVVFLVGAFVVIPKVMNWVPLVVLTGSMEPGIPPGSEIVVERIDTDAEVNAVRVGDVVTYMPKADDPMLITHRVIEIDHSSDGSRTFVFKGDANPSADPNPVEGKQIRGKLLYHIPLLGYVTNRLNFSQKSTGISLVAIALFGYAAWQVLSGIRSRRRSKTGEPAVETEQDGPATKAIEPKADRELISAGAPVQPGGWILPEDL